MEVTLSQEPNQPRKPPGPGRKTTHHPKTLDQAELEAAINAAKRAVFAESYDAEHDALIALLHALGSGELPDCGCDGAKIDVRHAEECPCHQWEIAGLEEAGQ